MKRIRKTKMRMLRRATSRSWGGVGWKNEEKDKEDEKRRM